MIRRFRKNYVEMLGEKKSEDEIYKEIREGRSFDGMENWMKILYENMEKVLENEGKMKVVLENMVNEEMKERKKMVVEN